MSRKKSVEANGTATLEAPETTTVPEAIPLDPSSETMPTSPTEGNGHNSTNGDKKKPLVSYRLNSDRSTSIELAVWSNIYVNRETNEDYEQLSVTVQRSYKDQNGAWVRGGSWRTHEIPVLQHLLTKAHAFALDRRTQDSSMPF